MITYFLLFLSLTLALGYDVTLKKRSTIYIPYSYNADGSGNYGLDKGSTEQMAYDSENKVVYIVGVEVFHAVDVSDPDNLTIVFKRTFPGSEFTDVEYCGGHVFASIDNKTVGNPGHVHVFDVYNKTIGDVVELFKFEVGIVPDMVKPTKDCSKLLISVEGSGYDAEDGSIIDPPGAVVLVNFPTGINTNYNIKTLNFEAFNDRVSSLRVSGVRHVYQENNNPFSNDVEPEYITFNEDNTVAYISLQENNAIAVVDMTTENITGVYGLGFKDWNLTTIDTSDKDNGAFLYPSAIKGMYQPDSIKFIRFKGENYIVTANEGGIKEYGKVWTEEKKGEDIGASILPADLDTTTRDQLTVESLLGRMRFSVSPAGMDDSGRLEALYTFGARGFSIRRAADMSLVYDSKDDISAKTLQYKKELFNGDVDKPNNRPFEDHDKRSDVKGAETESLAVGEVDGRTLLFIGNERPGTIFVFSISDDVSKPEFHLIFDGIPDKRGKTWQQMFDNREISELDTEDMHFVPGEKSPTGTPVLLATGTVSATFSILEVVVTNPAQTIQSTTPSTASTCAPSNMIGLLLSTILMTVVSPLNFT